MPSRAETTAAASATNSLLHSTTAVSTPSSTSDSLSVVSTGVDTPAVPHSLHPPNNVCVKQKELEVEEEAEESRQDIQDAL